MTKDDIIALPSPSLRKRSQKIGLITDEVKKLIADMRSATIDWENSRDHEAAVGLAAVQIDRLYKVFIIRKNFDQPDQQEFQVFINPEIVKKDGELVEDFEGCLSVPDVYGKIKRHDRVKVKALDENGIPFRVTAHGYLARILQHETDHTHGILFIDHIKNQRQAFYRLMPEGGLEPLEYEKDIKNNTILWD